MVQRTGQTFISRVSAFLFRHFAEALLNSTPQLRARDRCAVAQLGPGDLRIEADAQAQSVPAVTFSRPTSSALLMCERRPVTGCSKSRVVWLTTPEIKIFPAPDRSALCFSRSS
jgi:hypothetical protein